MKRQDDRWWLRVADLIPREGKSSKGRQQVRWADEIGNFAGITWPQLEQDRVVGEAFVLHGDDGDKMMCTSIGTFLRSDDKDGILKLLEEAKQKAHRTVTNV